MRVETITKALADPTRLRIMRLLARMDLAIGEVAHVLGQSQPRVSRHVAILCSAGLAERRREGSWTFLRISVSKQPANALGTAIAALLDAAEGTDADFAARCDEDRRHLVAIRAARAERAAEYFAKHAPDWEQLRSMITPGEEAHEALRKALAGAGVGQLLDIGSGTGSSAEALADMADHITGLDRSPEMLNMARARLADVPADRWDLVQGDFHALPFAKHSFDTVLLHQVLHFAANPLLPLAEAARVCVPGGRIAIVDLAAHNHEELRERHAHERLGFSDEQMLEWLSAHGFALENYATLPGVSLTTKIWVARGQSPVTPTQSLPTHTEPPHTEPPHTEPEDASLATC